MKRDEIFEYISEKFGVLKSRVFDKYPEFAVFRHENNKKWFALILKVDAKKLRLNDEAAVKFSGDIAILNLKCRPDLARILADDERIMPAYHMNKKHWISVNLASDISKEQVFDLIDQSFDLTK